jgi:hypothetical protein
MARLRVFISSTYYDLKYVRASLGSFLQSLGFEVVLSEWALVPYDHESPLDESCYAEIQNADMFVLIVGGRAGSPASPAPRVPEPDTRNTREKFFTRYDTVTSKEYEYAFARGIPIHTFVESSVFYEYKTYRKNTGREDIDYSSVENVIVFLLLDRINKQVANRAVEQFEEIDQITNYLREQFSGSYRQLLTRKSQSQQLSDLREQVHELRSITDALRSCIANLAGNADRSVSVILQQTEKKDLDITKAVRALKMLRDFDDLIYRVEITYRDFARTILESNSLDEILQRIEDDSNVMNASNIARTAFHRGNLLYFVNEIRRNNYLPEIVAPGGPSYSFGHSFDEHHRAEFNGVAALVARVICEFAQKQGKPVDKIVLDNELATFAIEQGLADHFISSANMRGAIQGVLKRLADAAPDAPPAA